MHERSMHGLGFLIQILFSSVRIIIIQKYFFLLSYSILKSREDNPLIINAYFNPLRNIFGERSNLILQSIGKYLAEINENITSLLLLVVNKRNYFSFRSKAVIKDSILRVLFIQKFYHSFLFKVFYLRLESSHASTVVFHFFVL